MVASIYSPLLIEFIAPICNDETATSLHQKCLAGQTAWNLCIARELGLPIADEMEAALNKENKTFPQMKAMVDMLIQRKQLHFDQHKQFVFLTEQSKKIGWL